ncbi:MAG: ATP-dependent Clp protease adaptor ClpS [Proteobacteria bacterium]|nr:ATP-dependent Clp protease adaptor ClpS [Pseudomonadota bacterium]MBQ9242352.1 ATP-dependent Clp protease adaptor ClpS [Pseudomonadota bacterium]
MAFQRDSQGSIESDVDVLDIQIPLTRVILYNDDYTTFEFVIHILMQVFKKSEDEAVHITKNVHIKGKGVAGAYPREIAQMKVAEVHKLAEEAGYPLRAGIEN